MWRQTFWISFLYLLLWIFSDRQVALSPQSLSFLTCKSQGDNDNHMHSQTRTVQLDSVQLSSVTQSCLTLCDPMNRSTPGLPVHHHFPEFTQTHIHQVSEAIQPSHPLSSPSPPAPNPSQHQSLFQWVNFSHEVAKVLEFQLQHQSFQWKPRNDLP